jgi:hypothetical protein
MGFFIYPTPTMMKLDYEQLLINENAYFFKLRRPLAKRDIETVFEQSLRHKHATRMFEPKLRESYIHGASEIAKISYDVFKFKRKPSFLTDDVPNTYEVKYGLFLIVESSDLIAVIRKNVSGIKELYSLVDKIDYNILIRFLLSPETKYEKIVTNGMNVASNAMQRKTNEAEDLQALLSRFGTSKQIISSLRVGNRKDTSTVTVNTSRVNSFNVQNEFVPALLWMVDMMSLIRRAIRSTPQSHFIDSFAKPIKYDDVIDDIIPTYLIIRFCELKDEVDSGLIEKVYDATTRKAINFERDVFSYERLFELDEDSPGVYKADQVTVKVKEEYISISVEPFKNIMLDFGGDNDIDLNTYIKRRHAFLIVFDKPQYVYSHGRIFEDSRLLGDKEHFMSTFIPYDELRNIDSEKGTNYLATSTSFKPNSLFKFVEDEFGSTASYLVCDDLGTEWGDFISIGEDEIIFFHLKHNGDGLSATNLETVFGQAEKNFGVLQLTEELIEARRTKWSGNYRVNRVVTAIKRMRKHPAGQASIDDLIIFAALVSSNPHVRRRVYVVVNFISKTEMSRMFDVVKGGRTLANQGVVLQLIWLINGILALTTELNSEFKILCRP